MTFQTPDIGQLQLPIECLPLVDLELVEALVALVFVVVEEGLDEVVVDDLGLPLEQPLLQVERGQVPDLVRLVQQCLHDLEEECAPATHLEVVLLEEVDEGDKGGPPHHEGGVAQARSDLRQQRVHQGGVPEGKKGI